MVELPCRHRPCENARLGIGAGIHGIFNVLRREISEERLVHPLIAQGPYFVAISDLPALIRQEERQPPNLDNRPRRDAANIVGDHVELPDGVREVRGHPSYAITLEDQANLTPG